MWLCVFCSFSDQSYSGFFLPLDLTCTFLSALKASYLPVPFLLTQPKVIFLTFCPSFSDQGFCCCLSSFASLRSPLPPLVEYLAPLGSKRKEKKAPIIRPPPHTHTHTHTPTHTNTPAQTSPPSPLQPSRTTTNNDNTISKQQHGRRYDTNIQRQRWKRFWAMETTPTLKKNKKIKDKKTLPRRIIYETCRAPPNRRPTIL